MEFDPVKKPKHYNVHPSGVECIDIVGYLPYPVGNAIKYVWRFEDKDKPLEDLEKAMWYLNWCSDHQEWLGSKSFALPDGPYDKLDAYYHYEFDNGSESKALCIWFAAEGNWSRAKGYLNDLAAEYNAKVEAQKSGGSEPVTLQEDEFVIRKDIEADEDAAWQPFINMINNLTYNKSLGYDQRKSIKMMPNSGGSVIDSPNNKLHLTSTSGKTLETDWDEAIELYDWLRSYKTNCEALDIYYKSQDYGSGV